MNRQMTALTLAVATGLAIPALAQQPDAQRLEELERRVEILSRELENQRTSGAQPEATASSPDLGLGAAAAKVYQAKGGLSVGGYGEFLYMGKENHLQDGTSDVGEKNLDALRLVLYTGYKFSDRILFNSEVEFEHGGYSDDLPEGEVIVEFAYLDFLLSKAINVRAGQLLVPMGFINEQHEPPAFLGSRRPQVERSIIPTTWHENGLGIHGELRGGFNYRLYLINGLVGDRFSASGIRSGRQAGKEANAQSLAWTGRLDWSPAPGATAGFSFYRGNSNQAGGEAFPTQVLDVHGEWLFHGLQVRGLYARTTLGSRYLDGLEPADSTREAGTRQWGGYLEAGYDLLDSGRQSLIPFVRWERLNTQAQVIGGVVPGGANDQSLVTLGVSYKPIPNIAVKVDYQKVENHARTGQNQFNAALGFYF